MATVSSAPHPCTGEEELATAPPVVTVHYTTQEQGSSVPTDNEAGHGQGVPELGHADFGDVGAEPQSHEATRVDVAPGDTTQLRAAPSMLSGVTPAPHTRFAESKEFPEPSQLEGHGLRPRTLPPLSHRSSVTQNSHTLGAPRLAPLLTSKSERKLLRKKTKLARRHVDEAVLETVKAHIGSKPPLQKRIEYTPKELQSLQRQFMNKDDSDDGDWDPLEGLMAAMVLQENTENKKPFDEYEYEKLDDEDFLAHPYIEPVIVRATRKRDEKMFRKGIAPFWHTSVEDMQTLGVGISLYFRFLQYLIVTFFFMTLVSIPTMYLNFLGNQVTVDQRDPLGLSLLTLGNNGVANGTACVGSLASANCTEDTVDFFGNEIRLTRAAYIISFTDVLSSGIFLAFILFFQIRMRNIVRTVDHNHVTASDYSVYARGFPEDATIQEVREHFSALYQLKVLDWEYDGWCLRFGMKIPRNPKDYRDRGKKAAGEKDLEFKQREFQPVQNSDNTGDEDYEGGWVAAVSIAHKNGRVINKYLKARELLAQIRSARARLKKFSINSKFADLDEEEKARQALAKLERKQEKLNRRISKKDVSCVCAYVTFQHEESYLNCVQDYQGSQSWWGRFWQPPPLRFRQGWYPLHVEPAPAPSNILWENLEASDVERFFRRLLVNLTSFLLLLISFAIIYFAQTKKQEFSGSLPALETCGEELPSLVFNGVVPAAVRYQRNFSMESACGVGLSYITVNGDQAANLTATPCLKPCVGPNSAERCDLGNGVFVTHSTLAACYCKQRLQEEIVDKGFFAGASEIHDAEGDLCVSFAEDFVASQAVTIAASMAVVLINTVLQKILAAATLWERNYTVTATAVAVTQKIFVALFMNTSLVVLLVYAKPPNDMKFPLDGIMEGPYDDFSVGWYTVPGVAIMFTLTANVIAPHIAPIAKACILKPLKIRKKRDTVTTQAEMNALYEGLPFEIETRYPLILNTVFSTLLYSSGLPALIPLALFSLVISFLVDKYSLLRLYSRPPAHDESLAEFSAYAMPFALLLHLLIGLWMYGNDDVLKSAPIDFAFMSSETFPADKWFDALVESMKSWDAFGATEKVTRLNTAPPFLFAAGVLCWLVFRESAGKVLLFILRQIWWVLTCGGKLNCKRRRSVASLASLKKWIEYPNRQWLPPFTDDFRQQMDPRKPEHVTATEAREGWSILDTNGRQFKIRTWQGGGIENGITHQAGECMRTWEVIAKSGLHSYDIMANRTYVPAMRALHDELLKRARDNGNKRGKRGLV